MKISWILKGMWKVLLNLVYNPPHVENNKFSYRGVRLLCIALPFMAL